MPAVAGDSIFAITQSAALQSAELGTNANSHLLNAGSLVTTTAGSVPVSNMAGANTFAVFWVGPVPFSTRYPTDCVYLADKQWLLARMQSLYYTDQTWLRCIIKYFLFWEFPKLIDHHPGLACSKAPQKKQRKSLPNTFSTPPTTRPWNSPSPITVDIAPE